MERLRRSLALWLAVVITLFSIPLMAHAIQAEGASDGSDTVVEGLADDSGGLDASDQPAEEAPLDGDALAEEDSNAAQGGLTAQDGLTGEDTLAEEDGNVSQDALTEQDGLAVQEGQEADPDEPAGIQPFAGFAPKSRQQYPSGSPFDAPLYGQISLVSFKAVANGCMGGIALDTSGYVWTWGYNLFGQLGVNKTDAQQHYYGGMKRIPYFAQNRIRIIEIGASYESRYALDSDGYVYAWGHGANGAMGNGTNTSVNIQPARVPSLSNVKHIYVSDSYLGYADVFALTEDGLLYAWGYNASSMLGMSKTTTVTTPTLVPLPSELAARSIVKVSCGRSCSFILDDQGDLWSSGSDSVGQQGNGAGSSNSAFTKMDRSATGMAPVVDVDVSYHLSGGDRAVASDVNGDAWEWGGTYGDGSLNALIYKQLPQKIVLNPTEVAAVGYIPLAQEVIASERVCYFIDQHGRPWGWGTGYYFGFGRDGGWNDSNSQVISSKNAQQVPKFISDGDTQDWDRDAKFPVYLGGTKTANTTYKGYGFNTLHPTIYDEKYMLKDEDGNVVDDEGNPLRYGTAGSGRIIGMYYRSEGGEGNAFITPLQTGIPAIDPDEWLWIRLAFQPVPFIAQMDCSLSAYAFLDANGNLYKWGNDGSGSIAWGWDLEAAYDPIPTYPTGALYDRYTYEVMYMRGSPMIGNVALSAETDKKVYAVEGEPVENPVDVKVCVPAKKFDTTLEEEIYSNLTELKYLIIPYDKEDATFNLDIDYLDAQEFMALYDNTDDALKGDLLDATLASGESKQEMHFSIDAPINGRLIIFGANERFASDDAGSGEQYLNEDSLFVSLIIDNVYTPITIQHKGQGENPGGDTQEVYAPTGNAVAKTNDDSADTGKPFDETLFGLPLDAHGGVIGATKNPDGSVSVDEEPRYGYDRVLVESYEVCGYPPDAAFLNYWDWMEMVDGEVQAQAVLFDLNDMALFPGYVHPFLYEPNGNWTAVSGAKSWNDQDDSFELRPTEITLTLKQYARDVETGERLAFLEDVETITVADDGSGSPNVWPFSFPTWYMAYEYTYEVVEDAVPYYTTTVNYPRLVPDDPEVVEDFTGITIVNTLDFKPLLFIKVDGAGNAITGDTAEFSLTNAVAGGTVRDTAGAEQDAIALSTDTADGTFVFPREKPGTYRLTETKAPEGFNLLTKEVVVTIGADGSITATLGSLALGQAVLSPSQEELYAAAFELPNRQTTELPSAGGFEDAVLYGVSTVALCTASLFMRRLRKEHE